MAAVDLPVPGAGSLPAGGSLPRVGSLPGVAPSPGVIAVDTGGAYSLRVFDAGLACCAVEVAAALRRSGDLAAAGEGEGPLNVFVVAGTVTDKLAPFVLKAFQDTPPPRRVLSFGACSNSGGPYWDSYCVTKGVDQFIPVDVYVPGCPPRPEALLAGLAMVLHPPGDGSPREGLEGAGWPGEGP